VIADGHQGAAIQTELHRRRLSAVKDVLRNADTSSDIDAESPNA
jgi:hypothetical protein